MAASSPEEWLTQRENASWALSPYRSSGFTKLPASDFSGCHVGEEKFLEL